MSDSISKLINFYRKEVFHPSSVTKPYIVPQELRKFASLFAPDKFYYYVINFQNLNMDYVSEGTRELLGIEPGEFTINELLNRIHPDDLKMMEMKEALITDFLINYLEPSKILSYKKVYFFRILGKNNKYRKILHQTNVLSIGEPNIIQHVLCIHTDISHLPILFNDKISLIGLDNNESFFNLDVTSTKFTEVISKKNASENLREILTSKEKEIIKYLVKGLTAKEIAKEMYISFDTVRTHRKNILAKSKCKNSAELISRCLIEGIV